MWLVVQRSSSSKRQSKEEGWLRGKARCYYLEDGWLRGFKARCYYIKDSWLRGFKARCYYKRWLQSFMAR